MSIHAAAIKACEWFDIPLEEVKTSGRCPAESAVKPEQNAPNTPLKFRLDRLQHEEPCLIERGIALEAATGFCIGYFTGDKGLMVGRVVIPIHNIRGELVAYAGCCWPGEPPDANTEKCKLPPKFKKMQELLNLDRAIKESPDKPLVIVEGFFDVIKLHQHGCRKVVAIMGSTPSEAQVELIHWQNNSQRHVIVGMDEHKAGAECREDIARRSSKFCFMKVHVSARSDAQSEHLTADQVHQSFL